MKLVTDIKDANYITHSGTMHADDVFATAFLDLYKKDISLIRLPSVDNIELNDNILVYDIGRKKYDHHQEDAEIRENKIKYSSFGLLFKDFGRDFLKQQQVENIDDIFLALDKDLVEGIDAIDNGLFPEIIAPYKVKNISDVIKSMNPSYGCNQNENEQFIKAVELAKLVFMETLYNIIGKEKAKKIILTKLDEEKQFLELDEYIPYEETILKSDKGRNIKLVLYPSNRGGYGIKTLRKSLEDKTERLLFPESWAGLEHQELEKVSGIKGISFCHSNRFLVICKTKEACYEVLNQVLKK